MALRIGIIGGGIGGLTLAVAFSRTMPDTPIELDIYEAASELTQIGAGITIWPRTWQILQKLGLEEALAAHLSPGEHIPNDLPRLAFQFRKGDQKVGVPIRDLVIAGTPLNFHRSAIQEVLLQHISSSVRCHLSSRLTSYTTSSPGSHEPHAIKLVFSDGRTATCDVLVGADGLKSIVRRQFLAENPVSLSVSPGAENPLNKGDLVWSGSLAYRCMVDSTFVANKMPDHRVFATPVIYCGKNKHIVAYSMLRGRLINIVAYVSDIKLEGTVYKEPSSQDVPRDEVISVYDTWEEEVRVLVHGVEKASRWAIHAIEPLDIYAAGGVILLGDAAHAMTPHQGNGAGQAIEDAYILAELISKSVREKKPIDSAIRAYNQTRQPIANFVQKASRKHGLLYDFNSEDFKDVQVEGDDSVPEERLKELGKLIVDEWKYAWMSSADADLESALKMI